MQDLKNLKCLLPKTETLLLKMVDECSFLEKYVLVGGSALALCNESQCNVFES